MEITRNKKITIDANDKNCGECDYFIKDEVDCYCTLFVKELKEHKRCQECIAKFGGEDVIKNKIVNFLLLNGWNEYELQEFDLNQGDRALYKDDLDITIIYDDEMFIAKSGLHKTEIKINHMLFIAKNGRTELEIKIDDMAIYILSGYLWHNGYLTSDYKVEEECNNE